MEKKQRKLFCDICPAFFVISRQKEILKRKLHDRRSKVPFAHERSASPLPCLVSEHRCKLIKTGKGIDPVLQENKAVNIAIACNRLNGILIHPGEVFSFWKLIGKTSRRRGFRDGRVIVNNKLVPGTGGGLCNLGNSVNWLVMHSPLTITELHKHADTLAPDHGKRVPFSAGTSVCYNYIDYRFRNDTDQDVQLLTWCEDGQLCTELRSRQEFPWTYDLTEEDHHFSREGDQFYRISKIYRNTYLRSTGERTDHKLVWDNHSLVMYDPDQIPKELIR